MSFLTFTLSHLSPITWVGIEWAAVWGLVDSWVKPKNFITKHTIDFKIFNQNKQEFKKFPDKSSISLPQSVISYALFNILKPYLISVQNLGSNKFYL